MKLALAFTAALLTALAIWWFASKDANTPVAAAPTHTRTSTGGHDAPDSQPLLESEAAPTDAAAKSAPETARAEITESEQPEPAVAEHPEFARFDLRVVSRETGKPVPNHRVTLFPDGPTVWNGRPGRGSVALPGESARTNAHGEATLFSEPRPEPLVNIEPDSDTLQRARSEQVQLESSSGNRPGRFLYVARFGNSYVSDPVGPTIVSLDAFHVDHRVTLEPFEAGERRSVTLAVRVNPDRLVHGLVLDSATRAPLAGAVVRLDSETKALSDENGAFFVAACSWEHKEFDVALDGYLTVETPLETGNEDPTNPRIVLLTRSSQMKVSVVDARGLQVSAQVTARLAAETGAIDQKRPRTWSASASPKRPADLFGLPANVDIELHATTTRGLEVTRTLRTTPGNQPARVVLQLPHAATVVGVLVGFQPLADREVRIRKWYGPDEWAKLAQYDYDRSAWITTGRITFQAKSSSDDVVRTDSLGRFAFEDVGAGRWQVACSDDSERTAGASLIVDVNDKAQHEIVLEAQPAAWIRGSVLSCDGEPLAAIVSATALDGSFSASVRAHKPGEFKLGPVPPGTYRVRARSMEKPHMTPPSQLAVVDVELAPGTNTVELRSSQARWLAFFMEDSEGDYLFGAIEAISRDGRALDLPKWSGLGAHVAIDIASVRDRVTLRALSNDGSFASERAFAPSMWTSELQTWRLDPVAPPDKR